MRMQHLIDGKPVAGRDYFETVNPATQEVLAEVAARRRGRSQCRRRRRQGGLSRPGPALPATERAKLMRKLGDLIAKHVPEICGDRDATTPAR